VSKNCSSWCSRHELPDTSDTTKAPVQWTGAFFLSEPGGGENPTVWKSVVVDYNEAASGKRFLVFTGARILAIAFDSI
jgi:hypothetical protein